MVVYTCSFSTWEAEAGRLQIRSQPGLYNENLPKKKKKERKEKKEKCSNNIIVIPLKLKYLARIL
jgi:hypothetical protein